MVVEKQYAVLVPAAAVRPSIIVPEMKDRVRDCISWSNLTGGALSEEMLAANERWCTDVTTIIQSICPSTESVLPRGRKRIVYSIQPLSHTNKPNPPQTHNPKHPTTTAQAAPQKKQGPPPTTLDRLQCAHCSRGQTQLPTMLESRWHRVQISSSKAYCLCTRLLWISSGWSRMDCVPEGPAAGAKSSGREA